jgi:glycosyltransferase involved in cell wall biosynthesis
MVAKRKDAVVLVLAVFTTASMALKILTVLAGAPVGGAETFFVSLSRALKRSGLAVRSLLKPNPARQAALKEENIVVDTAPFRARFDWVTKRTVRRVAAEFQPDAVLAFAGRAASLTPKGDYALIGRLGGYYNLNNFKHCDHLVCNAPDLVRYVTQGGWAKDRVHLIPNFPSLPDAAPLKRSAFGTPKDAPLAVALGRLHRAKALDMLIRAAALIPELYVWIAGEGPERAKLERLSRDLGTASRIKFLGWRTDRAALYACADVCVYPSREEPFGNVVVEAWASGTPIVATASTGPKWLVKDQEDGILTAIDDPRALAEGIGAVLSSRTLAAALVRAGRVRMASEFSEAAIVRCYVELFERVRR